MSNDFVVKLSAIGKDYPLYRSSSDKFWSLFFGKRQLNVHRALSNVDLLINKGEKVALIGRNGAGKSTLLKIITRAIDPTRGDLEVRGHSHALLQLGVGFHPEFSGRENAQSFFAHLGHSGAKAKALVEEAVEFAEIEEYIDQPLKTYSSGMAARLMFAVSTAVNPQLLVVDEVLGVGDAYFQNKSFERIREMCDDQGTTLILVSHDIYSAAKLCDRMIWLEKGAIYADGEPTEILKLYEDSIRLQEDARQKQKLAIRYRESLGSLADQAVFIELRARGNEPAASPLFISKFCLQGQGKEVDMPLRDKSVEGDQFIVERLTHTAWGDLHDRNGGQARAWNNYGTVEHKVGFAMFPKLGFDQDWLATCTVFMECESNDTVDADLVFVVGSEEKILGRVLVEPGGVQGITFDAAQGTRITVDKRLDEGAQSRQGSGRLVVTGTQIYDADGNQSLAFRHGDKAVLCIEYRVHDPDLHERCQVALVFKRNGVEDVMRLRGLDLEFDAKHARVGVIEVSLDPIILGVGKYAVTVLIAKEGYYEDNGGQFFSINPDVYDCQANCLEFEVYEHDSVFPVGTGFVGQANMRLVFPTSV